jgi:chemotaxis protein methyltransferase CheR
MQKSTFNQLRKIIYEKSGISLGEQKETLVCARLGKRLRALGICDYRSYLRHVMEDETGEEIVMLLDAISTNVTSFFREPDHFEFLGEAVSKWFASGQTRFRFWSAASSTGEEPYSIAMTLIETLNGRSADTKILATDISTRVLEGSLAGSYTNEKMKNVPLTLRDRYFDARRDESGVSFAARGILKRLVVFKRLNLAAPPFPMRGPFDAIFCRNVMIYFDDSVRKNLLAEMYRLLKPGGYLMVGHAESLTGMVSDFKSVKPSIYLKQ